MLTNDVYYPSTYYPDAAFQRKVASVLETIRKQHKSGSFPIKEKTDEIIQELISACGLTDARHKQSFIVKITTLTDFNKEAIADVYLKITDNPLVTNQKVNWEKVNPFLVWHEQFENYGMYFPVLLEQFVNTF